jgi:hypothetical protein
MKNNNNNKMKIAILSYGGLTKTGGKLVKTKWTNKGTPALPIEMVRVSKTGKLVLAISEKHGVQNNVYVATAAQNDLNKAIADFMKLEKIGDKQIGILDLKKKVASSRSNEIPNISRNIAQWARKAGYDAVIFNGLTQKFKDAINIKWSVENAVNYVKNLDAKKRKAQLEYLTAIPKTINTPVLALLTEKPKAPKAKAAKVKPVAQKK